jgi:hypothetical protein
MAQTRFTGPVVSDNGFVGAFTGGTTNLALTGTLSVDGASTLTGAVAAPAGVTGDLTGNVTGYIILPTSDPEVAGALWNDGGVITVSAG